MAIQRREVIFTALSASTLILIGCQREPKPSSMATLVNNQAVHDAVKSLIDAVDGLENNIANFDTENWKDVVPDVRTAASNVSSAVGVLRQALGYSDSR